VDSYLTLVDIPDFWMAIREMARVLKPGGALLIANLTSFTSACADRGWMRDEEGRRLHFPVDRYLDEFPFQLEWADISIENWQSATCFNEVQRAALAFTDEIVKLHKPTDATFNAIASKLTPAALVELQLSVGFYIMTSKFLETFAIDLQPVTEVVS
jgi:hypothetical protein